MIQQMSVFQIRWVLCFAGALLLGCLGPAAPVGQERQSPISQGNEAPMAPTVLPPTQAEPNQQVDQTAGQTGENHSSLFSPAQIGGAIAVLSLFGIGAGVLWKDVKGIRTEHIPNLLGWFTGLFGEKPNEQMGLNFNRPQLKSIPQDRQAFIDWLFSEEMLTRFAPLWEYPYRKGLLRSNWQEDARSWVADAQGIKQALFNEYDFSQLESFFQKDKEFFQHVVYIWSDYYGLHTAYQPVAAHYQTLYLVWVLQKNPDMTYENKALKMKMGNILANARTNDHIMIFFDSGDYDLYRRDVIMGANPQDILACARAKAIHNGLR